MQARFDRRSLVAGAGAAITSALAGQAPAAAQPLPSMAAQEAGLAPDVGDRLDAGVRSGLLGNLHGVVVLRRGHIALERYYRGPDTRFGTPIGEVGFNAGTLHDMRSVTKSIVSLLYGIARARNQVPPPEAPLFSQFPRYADLAADAARARRTIEHALTMTLGMEWDEASLPYTNPANSEIAMERSADRYRFALDRPLVAEPGTRWIYSGGATALLAAIISQGTGKRLTDFAWEELFEPLGITAFEWARGRDGVPQAPGGLRLTPRDQARIAQLLLRQGRWGDRQIVPAAWLEASFRPRIATGQGTQYGYQWWLGEETLPAALGARRERWMSGFGNGGQRLWLMPALDLAVIVTAGGYDQPGSWLGPTRVWREIVLGNLRS